MGRYALELPNWTKDSRHFSVRNNKAGECCMLQSWVRNLKNVDLRASFAVTMVAGNVENIRL